MPPPPPPTGAQITVYRWTLNPGPFVPCSTCVALTGTPSLTRRPRPHAFCVCIGDLPSLANCTFTERTLLESHVERHEVPGPVIPGHGHRDWTTSAGAMGGANISHEGGGTGASITGSITSGEETTWRFNNPTAGAIRIYETWENVTERWIDAVACELLDFSFEMEIPSEVLRQDFAGFISRPFEP